MNIIKVLTLAIAMSAVGCGWSPQDFLSKTHQVIKEDLSPRVESTVAAECNKREMKCKASGIELDVCKPLLECYKWAKTYVASSKALHTGLALMNELLEDIDDIKGKGGK